MTAAEVVVGWVLVGVQLAACAGAGVGARRRLVPAWRGPWAVLAAGVSGLAVLVGVGEVLGTVGLLRQWALPVALAAVAWLLWPRRASGDTASAAVEASGVPDSAAAPPVAVVRSPAVRLAGVVATAAVAAGWVERVVAVYRRGQTDGDSLMYHLVFAARFVQSGRTTGADPVGPDAWVAFYPATVELVEATVMLPFGTAVLVPLLSLGWLALALAASWCIGAEAGRGPLGLVVGALVCSVPVLVATQAGTARVDIAIIALVLAAVALVLHEPRTTGSCVVAGLALGLGVGSKFGLLPLAGLLLIGVAVVLLRNHGARAAGAWTGAAAVAGAYWYVRNWAVAGSPVPAIDLRLFGIGFAPLPEARRELLDGSSIVDNMGQAGFWGHVGRPVAEGVFAAPVVSAGVALAAVAVVVWIVARDRPLGLRHAVALAGVGGCIAYPLSPYSAPLLDAPVDSRFSYLIVALNVRYLLPALAVVLCLLPFALDRLGRTADVVLGAAALAVVYLWVDNMGFDAEWPTTGGDVAVASAIVAAAIGVALLARAVAPRLAGARWSPTALGASGVLVAAAAGCVVLTGWVAAGRTGVDRHDDLPAMHTDLWAAAAGVPADDVALVDDWVQYPLLGVELDRDVDYVGLPRDRGLSQPPRTCEELRTALAARSYDLVVVQRPLLAGDGGTGHVACLRDGGDAELVAETAGGAVFRLR